MIPWLPIIIYGAVFYAGLIYWGRVMSTYVIHYCYCDVEDGSDRVCTPGAKKECEAPWPHCPHFQMRRTSEQQEEGHDGRR